MNDQQVNLSNYNNDWYNPGANGFVRILWYFCNILFVMNRWNPFSAVRVFTLRVFGAKIGTGVVIKPGVNIKYPWLLEIGSHSWIGEGVWVDNLTKVTIGNNVCISQGAMLLCGNHNYKDPSFGLLVEGINISDGAWVGAKSIVGPGVKVMENAVLIAGSLASSDLENNGIYRGNPAQKIKERVIG